MLVFVLARLLDHFLAQLAVTAVVQTSDSSAAASVECFARGIPHPGRLLPSLDRSPVRPKGSTGLYPVVWNALD